MKALGMEKSKKNYTGLLDHLIECRCAAAKIFPNCGVNANSFIRRVQGFKLTKGELRALKRG